MDNISPIAGIILAILANVVMLGYTAGRLSSKVESLTTLLRDYMAVADKRLDQHQHQVVEVDRRVARMEGGRRNVNH